MALAPRRRHAPAGHTADASHDRGNIATEPVVAPRRADAGVDPAAPALVVATPDGELTGGLAEVVPVDLLLTPAVAQAPAAQGLRVRVEVDGAEVTARDGAGPFGLSGLGAGAHTLTFTLLGPDGAPRSGPLQRAERRLLLRPGDGR